MASKIKTSLIREYFQNSKSYHKSKMNLPILLITLTRSTRYRTNVAVVPSISIDFAARCRGSAAIDSSASIVDCRMGVFLASEG